VTKAYYKILYGFKIQTIYVFPLKATISTVMHTFYTRQNRSNGSQKRYGDINRTPIREVSNFIAAFHRKTEIVFVRNLNLIVRFGYRWLRHFEQEHAALVKLGSKRVYASEYLLSTIHTRFQTIVAMVENREWANCLLSCDWRWLAICLVNSELAVAPRDMYP